MTKAHRSPTTFMVAGNYHKLSSINTVESTVKKLIDAQVIGPIKFHYCEAIFNLLNFERKFFGRLFMI
jgi:hypothetical protein